MGLAEAFDKSTLQRRKFSLVGAEVRVRGRVSDECQVANEMKKESESR